MCTKAKSFGIGNVLYKRIIKRKDSYWIKKIGGVVIDVTYVKKDSSYVFFVRKNGKCNFNCLINLTEKFSLELMKNNSKLFICQVKALIEVLNYV